MIYIIFKDRNRSQHSLPLLQSGKLSHIFLKFVPSFLGSVPSFRCSEMIEQLSDSGFTGGGAGDSSLPSNDKQLPVAVKKQALRDLPNENNVTPIKSMGNSTVPKERLPVIDPDKVSGIKRPSSEVNPSLSQASSAVNGNLVYVRRKTEAEVGKIASSVTIGNNSDLQLSVKASDSNEKVHPSSKLTTPQIEAGNISRSPEPSLNFPAMPMNLPDESPLSQPLKSGNIMPSVDNKSLLPHPVGKSGNTMSSAENKSPFPHPLGKPGNTMSSTGHKSPLPQPLGKSSNTMSSTENKSPLPQPLGKSGNTMSSTENKSPLPQPLGKSGNTMSSTENKSLLPQPLGKSGNTMSSTENKSPLPQPLGKSGNTMSSTENKSPLPQPLGNSGIITSSSAENRSQLPRPVGNSGIINLSVENRSPLPHSLGKPGNIMSSVEHNHIPPASVTTKLDLHLQQRQSQPQMLLRGLDRPAPENYLHMLRSLSSVELSKLAFELEKRSIQLSCQEAKEMARVEILNVMGKPIKPSKSPTALPEQ